MDKGSSTLKQSLSPLQLTHRPLLLPQRAWACQCVCQPLCVCVCARQKSQKWTRNCLHMNTLGKYVFTTRCCCRRCRRRLLPHATRIHLHAKTRWGSVWIATDCCTLPSQRRFNLLTLAAFFRSPLRLRFSLCSCSFCSFAANFICMIASDDSVAWRGAGQLVRRVVDSLSRWVAELALQQLCFNYEPRLTLST